MAAQRAMKAMPPKTAKAISVIAESAEETGSCSSLPVAANTGSTYGAGKANIQAVQRPITGPWGKPFATRRLVVV